MENTVKGYTMVIAHDNGKTRIQTTATSPARAKAAVANAEGCPLSAIEQLREVPIQSLKFKQ